MFFFKKKFILFFCLNFASAAELDLKLFLDQVQAQNPQVLINNEKILSAEIVNKNLKAALYPNISYNISGNYQKDAVYTGAPKFGGNPYNLYSTDLKLTQTLYAYGALSALKVNEYDQKINSLNRDLMIRGLTKGAIAAYYQVLLDQKLLENLIKMQDVIKKSLATANERYKTGRGQLLDVLQVKTQLSLLTPQIEAAKSDLAMAMNQLVYYSGDRNQQSLTIKGQLKKIFYKDVNARLKNIDSRLLEYEINYQQIKQLDSNREIILGKHYPTLKLVGDLTYTNYKKAEITSDYSKGWSIQLVLNIPLFSGLSSQYDKEGLVSTERQLYYAKKDLENLITLNNDNSLKKLESTEVALTSAEEALLISGESQKEAAKNYRLATIDFQQYLLVEQAHLQAQNSLEQLKFQNLLAYLNYFEAAGKSFDSLVDFLLK